MSLAPLLVPFDGSRHARFAAAFARRLATATGATTTLLYVGDEPPAFLAEEAARFATPVHTLTRDGDVDAVIAEEVARIDAGLVVLGARGRSVLGGLLFGSTARALLSRCRAPTLVVHEDPEGHALDCVLAAVEAGPAAPIVAGRARALAAALGARLHLTTVMNVDKDLPHRPEAYGISRAQWNAEVSALAARTFGALGPADTSVRYGVPALEIRLLAAALDAAVVVCGRKGATGTDVDAWRSVAFALATQGPFATLVV